MSRNSGSKCKFQNFQNFNLTPGFIKMCLPNVASFFFFSVVMKSDVSVFCYFLAKKIKPQSQLDKQRDERRDHESEHSLYWG